MIYFLQPIDGGPVKIGTTENLESRRRKLEADFRTPLALLATMPGGRKEEREIHERFSHLRFPGTEQFRPASDLMAFIGRPLLVGANSDAIEAIEQTEKPVRLDLSPQHHERLETEAKKLGLSMASCARMIVIQWLDTQNVISRGR